MPTYYNGKEITPTSKISGLDLTGRSSITIGGRVISIDAPPARSMFIWGDGSYPDPNAACMMGPSDPNGKKAYIQDDGVGNYALFNDTALTSPLSPGWYWTDDTSELGGGPSPQAVQLDGPGRVVNIVRCGR